MPGLGLPLTSLPLLVRWTIKSDGEAVPPMTIFLISIVHCAKGIGNGRFGSMLSKKPLPVSARAVGTVPVTTAAAVMSASANNTGPA